MPSRAGHDMKKPSIHSPIPGAGISKVTFELIDSISRTFSKWVHIVVGRASMPPGFGGRATMPPGFSSVVHADLFCPCDHPHPACRSISFANPASLGAISVLGHDNDGWIRLQVSAGWGLCEANEARQTLCMNPRLTLPAITSGVSERTGWRWRLLGAVQPDHPQAAQHELAHVQPAGVQGRIRSSPLVPTRLARPANPVLGSLLPTGVGSHAMQPPHPC